MIRVPLLVLALLLAACSSAPRQAIDTPGGGSYYLATTPAPRFSVYGPYDPLYSGWGMGAWWGHGYYSYHSPYFYPHRFVVHYGWPYYGGYGHAHHPGWPPAHRGYAPHPPPSTPVAPPTPPPLVLRPPLAEPPFDDAERFRRRDGRVVPRAAPPRPVPAYQAGLPAIPAAGRPNPSGMYRGAAPRAMPPAASVSVPRASSAGPPGRRVTPGSERSSSLHDQ